MMKNHPEQDPLDMSRLFQTFDERRGFDIDPDLSSDVRVPVPHKPTLPDLAIALPEPDDENP